MLRALTAQLTVAALLAIALPAQADEKEKRIALVIGNSAYKEIPWLANAVNDADLMASKLLELGFEVIASTDADQRTMKKAIKVFGDKLAAAGAEGVGLFYYAGHGVQADGINYLIPLSAEIADESDLDIEAVSANAVLRQMEWAGTGLNFVILDACRSNPYRGRFREVTRGLARMLAPRGSLISYATEPGGLAYDGAEGHSPYTAALARAITVPGLPVEQVFKRVRRAVLVATDNTQTTWESSSLTDDFYFVPPEETASEAPAPQPASPPATDENTLDLAFWESIKDSTNPDSFYAYRTRFPEGVFIELATLRIEELETAEAEVASLPSATETPGFEIEEMEAPYRVVTRANLRAGPSTESERVGQLEPGTEITVTGKVRGRNWFRVASAGGVQGFIYGELIRDEASYQLALATPPQPTAPPSPTQPVVGVYPGDLRPGDGLRDCDKCPLMVVVPAGSFTMGSPESEKGRFSNEGPQHRVTIPAPFAVGLFEVTFEEWDACVADGGCGEYKPSDNEWGRGRRPVIEVSWADAKRYIWWLSRKTGKRYRLLTESEWEYAARAGTNTPYFQGNDIGSGNAVCKGCGSQWDDRMTAPVGSFTPNGFGLYDMQGNVFEFVEDCWHGSYRGAPDDGSAWSNGGDCSRRVLRGGSWKHGPGTLRAAFRHSYDSDTGYPVNKRYIGFRVARDL